MKLKEIIFKYIDYYKYQVKAHTYWIYFEMAKRVEDDIVITQNTTEEYLNEYLVSKSFSYSTKKMLKSLINRSLDFAKKSKLLCCDAKITAKLRKTEIKKVEALSKQEQKKIEDYILSKKLTNLYGVIICLYTGIRLGELLALTWENIDFNNNQINIKWTSSYYAGKLNVDSPKTISSIRQIPIAKILKPILYELKRINPKFVLSSKCTKISPRTYQKRFNCMLKILHIKHYGFHSLRHTFASRLMEKSIDVKTISELLGHSNANVTLGTYVHTNDFQKNNALTLLCA